MRRGPSYPDSLRKDSVIYSFGVGRDISFDLALIEKFGVKVFAFDPTSDSVEWIRSLSLPNEFKFVPLGLSDYDGEAQFFAPASGGSHSLLNAVYNTEPVMVEVHKLSTLMDQLGHSRIDLLKMDIEGAEFPVLEDILKSKIPITQILVEFHHRFKGIGTKKAIEIIRFLRASGYRVFHVSPSGEEVSFVAEMEIS